MVVDCGVSFQGLASGAHTLWSYHRGNYFYDRKQRQEQEYQIMEYRLKHTALWREDVRDLIDLTERKMDSYHVICALSLEYCITMFTEGRLEAGTPRWLLRFYTLTLAAAFSYMLLAIWFCMHASVVAQSTLVRLLTQFVRLYIPSWQQIEAARTYAVSYETRPVRQMLRVPLLGMMPMSTQEQARPCDWERNQQVRCSEPMLPNETTSGDSLRQRKSRSTFADPWGLEYEATQSISELQPIPTADRNHAKLVRRVSVHYQAYDAWARVCMSFGMIQLLNAINYFCYGYLSVQEGSPASAGAVGVIFMVLNIIMLEVDWSLSKCERIIAEILMATAPICTFVAVFWATVVEKEFKNHVAVAIVLPIAYASHALWFLWAVHTLGVEKTHNGSVLPLRFRSVLYLDVFGWSHGRPHMHRGGEARGGSDRELARAQDLLILISSELEEYDAEILKLFTRDQQSEIETLGASFQSVKAACSSLVDNDSASDVNEAERPSWKWVEVENVNQTGRQMPCYYHLQSWRSGVTRRKLQRPLSGNVLSIKETAEHVDELLELVSTFRDNDPKEEETMHSQSKRGRIRRWFSRLWQRKTDKIAAVVAQGKAMMGAAHVEGEWVNLTDIDLFSPATFFPYGKAIARDDQVSGGDPIITGHDHWKPGIVPAKIFRIFSSILAVLWFMALILSFDVPFGFASFKTATLPTIEERMIEKAKEAAKPEVNGEQSGSVTGSRVYLSLPSFATQASPSPLVEGRRISVDVQGREGFVARTLSCDASGRRHALADDMAAFVGELDDDSHLGIGIDNWEAAATKPLNMSFHRLAPCMALEGLSLKDLVVSCAGGEGSVGDEVCSLFALVSHPPHVAQCPYAKSGASEASTDTSSDVANGTSWKLRGGWLDDARGEKPVALASSCQAGGLGAQKAEPATQHLRQPTPSHEVEMREPGLLLGTSAGRVIAVTATAVGRANAQDQPQETSLVPVAVALQSNVAARASMMEALPANFSETRGSPVLLQLRPKSSSIEARLAGEGSLLGHWSLPRDVGVVSWQGLCSSSEHLFALGTEVGACPGDRRSVLWRFRLPDMLAQKPPAPVPPSGKSFL